MDKIQKYIPVLITVILFIGLSIGVFFLAKSHPEKVLELLGEQLSKYTTGTPLVVYKQSGAYPSPTIEYRERLIKIKQPTFIDNAFSHSSSPDVVYEASYDSTGNKTYDSIFVKEVVEKLPKTDVMLMVDKSKDELNITTINQKKKVLRKYIFTGIGNSFTAASDTNNVIVRTDNFELNGISLYMNLHSPFNLDSIKAPSVNVGIETGITAFNRLRIEPGIQYNFLGSKLDLNNFQINIKTSYKIKL
jgi:hypothetical protein